MAVVTAYLMKTEGLGWQEAYAVVRTAKPDAEWVPGPCPPSPPVPPPFPARRLLTPALLSPSSAG